jgi:uncharacterized DUF497 family protein
MNGLAFEWDCRKNSLNARNHGVEFAEASTVFDDPLSITIADPDHSADEERLIIVGMSDKQTLLVVVHTVREERVRLLSARLATKHERRNYEEGESVH